MSYKVTVVPGVGTAQPTVAIEDAKIADIITTALSTDSAVTGTYGLLQKAALFVGGMSVQSKRKQDTFNPFA